MRHPCTQAGGAGGDRGRAARPYPYSPAFPSADRPAVLPRAQLARAPPPAPSDVTEARHVPHEAAHFAATPGRLDPPVEPTRFL